MKRKKNEIIKIEDDYIILKLTHGKTTIIDIEDYEKICDFTWRADYCENTKSFRCTGYINNKKNERIHRFIMNIKNRNIIIDHINHDQLDNRKCNLRICTNSQNLMNRSKQINNTSGYKGVSYDKKNNKYCVRLKIKNKQIWVGRFFNKIIAAVAYDMAAIKYFGDFAFLNFPRENYKYN